jgi:hypothetical protein
MEVSVQPHAKAHFISGKTTPQYALVTRLGWPQGGPNVLSVPGIEPRILARVPCGLSGLTHFRSRLRENLKYDSFS